MGPSKGERCQFPASTGEEDIVGMEMLADFSTSLKLLPSKNAETSSKLIFCVARIYVTSRYVMILIENISVVCLSSPIAMYCHMS